MEILRRDRVARRATPSADALLRWQQAFAPTDQNVERECDALILNWFPIVSLPETIFVYEINRPLKNPVTEPATIAKERPLPVAAYMRRLVAFAPWDAFGNCSPKIRRSNLSEPCLSRSSMAGGDEKLSLPKAELGNPSQPSAPVFRLFGRPERDWKPYALSERKVAWWIPNGLLPENKVDSFAPVV